jgi:hypothetical protein
MSTPESAFKTRVVKNLKKLGFFCQTIETTTGRGVPDVWVCHSGVSAWLECKAPKANKIELRKEQRAWQLAVGINHHIPIFVLAEHQNDKAITLTHIESFATEPIVDKSETGQFKTAPDLCRFLYLYLVNSKKQSQNFQESLTQFEKSL